MGGKFIVTADNWKDIGDGDIEGAFASLSYDHDETAADNLIRYFCFVLQDGGLFASHGRFSTSERVFLEYIEYAFRRFVEKKSMRSLDTAFGLRRAKGQREVVDHSMRNLTIAAFVVLRMRSENVKWQDAIGDAANAYFPDGEGGRACEDAYAEYKDSLSSMPTEHLEIIARSNSDHLNV